MLSFVRIASGSSNTLLFWFTCGFCSYVPIQDEVSVFFKKLQAELAEKETLWRIMVAKIWHRLLAEYLRMKLEQALDKADQEVSFSSDKNFF